MILFMMQFLNVEMNVTKREQTVQAVKVCIEHIEWLNKMRTNVESSLFDLFDKNLKFKKLYKSAKNENYLINLEITHLKEFVPVISYFIIRLSTLKGYRFEIENLNKEKITLKEQISNLKKELVVARNRGKVMVVPKWIERPQTKRKEGLGFENHKKRNKPKNYVDLPCDKSCMYCGKKRSLHNSMLTKNMNNWQEFESEQHEMGC